MSYKGNANGGKMAALPDTFSGDPNTAHNLPMPLSFVESEQEPNVDERGDETSAVPKGCPSIIGGCWY